MMEEVVKKKEQPAPPPETGPPPIPTYAQKASTSAVIVLKKKVNGVSADIEKIHQAAVNTNASVSNTYKNNKGDTVVVCDNQESKDSLLPVLQQEMDNTRFSVVTPAQRLPTITIIDMHREYSKEELLERVKSHNASKLSGVEVDADTFRVLYIKKQVKNDKLFKKCRVSCYLNWCVY